MKRKRPRRKSQKPPPSAAALARAPVVLQYKVVELSTVDEGALERTVNEWVQKGWSLENVQFAMRESSKRPAMAFVFFTREGEPAAHDSDEARARLVRLADASPASHASPTPVLPLSAHERLAQLAGEDADAEHEGLTLEPDE